MVGNCEPNQINWQEHQVMASKLLFYRMLTWRAFGQAKFVNRPGSVEMPLGLAYESRFVEYNPDTMNIGLHLPQVEWKSTSEAVSEQRFATFADQSDRDNIFLGNVTLYPETISMYQMTP